MYTRIRDAAATEKLMLWKVAKVKGGILQLSAWKFIVPSYPRKCIVFREWGIRLVVQAGLAAVVTNHVKEWRTREIKHNK